MSEKHLGLYVDEFAGRHNVRELDTIDQMAFLAKEMVGKRLSYKELQNSCYSISLVKVSLNDWLCSDTLFLRTLTG